MLCRGYDLLAYAEIISVCNANMAGRDIVCIMPTGQSDTSLSVLSTTNSIFQ